MSVGPFLSPEKEEKLFEELEQRRSRREVLKQSVTPEMAEIASGLADAYPWLDPGVVQSLTQAGIPANSEEALTVAQVAALAGLRDNEFSEPAPDLPDSQFDAMWDLVSDRAAKALQQPLRLGMAALAFPFEEIVERALPAFLEAEEATPPRISPVDDPILGQFAPQNLAASLSRLTQGEFWDRFWTNLTERAAPSTLALAVGDFLSPDRSPALFGFDKRKGEGLIANFERRQELRSRLKLDGQAVTLGRGIARNVTEPGSTQYDLLSGLFDLGVNLAPVDLGLGKVAKGAGLISKAEIIRSGGRVGLLPGITRNIDLEAAKVGFLGSRVGRKLIDVLTEDKNVASIYEALGQRNLNVARELADTRTASETMEVLQRHLGLGLREVPTAGPVGQVVGRAFGDYGAVFGPGAAVRRSVRNVRMFQDMPTRPLNPYDIEDAAKTIHDYVRTVRLGDDVLNRYLTRLSEVKRGDAPALFRVATDLYDETFEKLMNENVGKGFLSRPLKKHEARKLTRAWKGTYDDTRAYFIDAEGRNADLAPARALIDDEVEDIRAIPHLAVERLNNVVPLPDIQGLKRATSYISRVWDIAPIEDAVMVMGFFTSTIWKPMQLITRAAYTLRVIGEEQARMAVSGVDSFFRHPGSYMAWVLGRKGKGFGANLFDEIDEFQRALTRGGRHAGIPGGYLSGHMVRVRKGHEQFFQGAALEIEQLAADRLARRVARGLSDKEAATIGLKEATTSLDDVKEWYWRGSGAELRLDDALSEGWERLAYDRAFADEYVDTVVRRISIKTGDNPDLVEAIGTGKLGDLSLRKFGAQKDLAKALESYEDSLPAWVKVDATFVDRTQGQKFMQWLDGLVQRGFHVLMSVPTNKLSRAPFFRQTFYRRMEELLGWADRPTQEAILKAAKPWVSRSDLRRMAKIVNAGSGTRLTSLQDAELLAKAHALNKTRDTLYDLSRRNNFFEAARLIFPFGEAWKEIIGAWSKLLRQNPSALRRAQQGLQGGLGPGFGELTNEFLGTGTLPGQGFFYEDPLTGKLIFNYPLSEPISKAMLNTDQAQFALTGTLSGLNLFSATVLPGVGPVIQIPAAAVLPNRPGQWETLYNVIFPFGEPELDRGVLESQLPAWMRKIRSGLFANPDTDRIYANTTMDVMRALVRSGEYSWNTQEEQQELLDAAKARAKMLFFIRGIAQSTVPTGPSLRWSTEDAKGNLVPVKLLADEYRRLMELYSGDSDRALTEWLRLFGAENLLALQGKTREIIYRPLTEQGDQWIGRNQDIVRDFPLVAGFFAPDPLEGNFDYTAYLRTVEEKTRQQLSPEEMLLLSNDFLGTLAWENAKSKVAGRNDAQTRLWLDTVHSQLQAQYRGFDAFIPTVDRPKPEALIEEIMRAIEDPRLADTDTAKAVRLYLEARAAAQTVVDENSARLNGSKSFKSSQSTKFLRDWLRDVAEAIIAEYPDFARVWQRAFRRELREDR